tara:strand:+ start:15879 stop:16301 length:423 start_codon:yes stop_codon:yes gene_type:complete
MVDTIQIGEKVDIVDCEEVTTASRVIGNTNIIPASCVVQDELITASPIEIHPIEQEIESNHNIYQYIFEKIFTTIFAIFFCALWATLMIFFGFLVCILLINVFNMKWDLLHYSVGLQITIYLGIGSIIMLILCLVINRNK